MTSAPKCPGCLGKEVTSIQYYQKYLDVTNPEVPANRAAEGSHKYCRIYHPNITDPALKALANIMGPQTYKDFKAAFPMKRTTIKSSSMNIKAFWCRDCQGVSRPPKAHLVTGILGRLGQGHGIQCKCRMSEMERIGEGILKSLPEYTDVKRETLITTKSPGQQKLDHTCVYKGYGTVFEWDGLQHFIDLNMFEKDFDKLIVRDIHKLNAIHDGQPVRGRRVKFLVRMAHENNPMNKIQRLIKYFESEVEELTSEELNDKKVIFICLREDENKYTPRGLPKHESTWDDAL